MKDDDLPTSTGRVFLALFCVIGFGASFWWPYSPERLLTQAVLVMLIINGFDFLFANVESVTVRFISAIAFFVPRTLLLAVVANAAITHIPETISRAMSQEGLALAFHAGMAALTIILWLMIATMVFIPIAVTVWADAFGPKAQSHPPE